VFKPGGLLSSNTILNTLITKLKDAAILKVLRRGSGRRGQVLVLAKLINTAETPSCACTATVDELSASGAITQASQPRSPPEVGSAFGGDAAHACVPKRRISACRHDISRTGSFTMSIPSLIVQELNRRVDRNRHGNRNRRVSLLWFRWSWPG